jgi:hypothetical protein
MKRGLGMNHPKDRSNGLARLAGSWSENDLLEFERAVAQFEQIDEQLWG